MAENRAKLLTDDEVARFITDGYLILTPDVSPALHQRIDERLMWLLHKEPNPGNNILPAVPEMHDVLNSSVVHGALTSILGHDYVLHPHRFVHNNEPGKVEDGTPKVGQGSHTFVGWHQDDHSPLARARYHFPRYAMVLYYPQDTPIEMGPTQLIPATHLNRRFTQEEMNRGIQAAGPAGTCVLVHFDIVHGGSLNIADRTRNMAKFVFARCSEPTEPAWENAREEWRAPQDRLAPYDNAIVWKRHWDWMRGADGSRSASANKTPAMTVSEARSQAGDDIQASIDEIHSLASTSIPQLIDTLIAAMDSAEPVRQAAIYALANLGSKAADELVLNLLASANREQVPAERKGWNEGCVVMEDAAYALAAMGDQAVSILMPLLTSDSEWVRVNVAFSLGEIGSSAKEAMPALIEALSDPSNRVVRVVLDAIGQIRIGSAAALPEIRRLLLAEDYPSAWNEPFHRKWTGRDQVRATAAMTLLRMGSEADTAEEWIEHALDDNCGYVGGFGVEFLMRRGSLRALNVACEYLYRHRWDSTLQVGMRTF